MIPIVSVEQLIYEHTEKPQSVLRLVIKERSMNHINTLAQTAVIQLFNTLEVPQSFIKPSIWSFTNMYILLTSGDFYVKPTYD